MHRRDVSAVRIVGSVTDRLGTMEYIRTVYLPNGLFSDFPVRVIVMRRFFLVANGDRH